MEAVETMEDKGSTPPPAVVEAPIPATPQSFAEFGVVAPIVEALALRDFHATFPIQALVLRDAIAGKDVLARSRTGSGKTLAFAIPIVQRLTHDRSSPSALILVPTRELASQVAEEFRTIADVKQLRVATVYGGVGLKEQADRATKSDIVIATPGRLLDLFRRRLLALNRVQIAVLDEAVNERGTYDRPQGADRGVVFRWSMCPIVPTFTCGFDRFQLFLCHFDSSRFVAGRIIKPPLLPGGSPSAACRLSTNGPFYESRPPAASTGGSRNRPLPNPATCRPRYARPCTRATTPSLTFSGACS